MIIVYKLHKHNLLKPVFWLVGQSKTRFTNNIFVFLSASTSILAPVYLMLIRYHQYT